LDLKLGIRPKQGISYLERKRGRGERETEKDGRDREIDGRNRKTEWRDIETEKQRDRADNKNSKQSWVAQLVYDNMYIY
jgi:hypothetical protein